jgi:flagellar motility protein MotE (MotC chaperone)
VPTATEHQSQSEKPSEKDLMTRLADAGEDALQRLSELPGGQRALTAFNDLRTRVDELGKKVRGIDALEERVATLEKELAALKKSKAGTRGSTARSSPKSPPSSTSS